jgi:PAS domain S-box-containing protein
MKKLKFFKNITHTFNNETDRKNFLIYLFSVTGLSILAVFFINGVIDKNLSYCAIILCLFITTLLNLIYFKFSKKIILAANGIMLNMCILCLAVFALIGAGITGVLWYYIYIPLAITLLGNKKGTIYCAVLLIITIILWLFFSEYLNLQYPNEFVIRFFITLIIVCFFINLFEYSREKTHVNYIKTLEDTKEKNEELKQLNEEIKAQKNEIEKQNQKITKAYDDLFKNEKKLAAIFETANEGIALVDKNANFTFVNSCVCEIFGYKPEEMLKLNYFELLVVTNDSNKENFRKLILGEAEVITTENQYFRKDKTKIWGKLSVRCLRNAQGEFQELVGILTDIDKLKKSEEKVKQSYQNIQLLSEIGKEITSNLNVENIVEVVYKNINLWFDAKIFAIGLYNSTENTLDFYGKSGENTPLEKGSDSLNNENHISVSCFKNQKPIFITDFLSPSNNLKYFNYYTDKQPLSIIYLPLIVKEKAIGVITVQSFEKDVYNSYHVDILQNIAVYTSIALENANSFHTIEKQNLQLDNAFNELFISNQKLQIILDSPTVGIGVCNPKADFIFCNNKLVEMVDCTNEELLTKNFIDFVVLEERKKVILSFRKLLRGDDEKISIDINFQRKDKSRIWANFAGASIKDENGNIKMIVGVLTDIEKIKQSEEKLKQSNQNIQLLSEVGKEITSNLKIENIVETVYQHLNKLMTAAVFTIGIFQPEKSVIKIYAKEKDITLEPFFYDLTDKNHLAVICFEQRREILINDMDVEYIQYIKERQKPLFDNFVSSIIYSPLMIKNECIGTISIQDYTKNAYNENNINILRNIAVYVSIALENGNAFLKIEEQKEEIEKTHNKITASINYAQRIQMAVLPGNEFVSILLPNNFILFKPRDIVSGDFYFIKQVKNYTVLAVGDCTGHGIPGAFMSMLGIAVLNEIIRNAAIISPSETLNELRKQIKVALQQTGGIREQHDGIDIAICVINIETMKMRYAGANNPLFLFKNEDLRTINVEGMLNELNVQSSKLTILEADRQPIGFFTKERPFNEHKVQLEKNDIFYIFSDGYISQFGNNNTEKFKTKRFKELLSEICCLPMTEQKQILEKRFDDWKGNNEQTDDVLVVGVKI